jgi:hypothetical protein
MKSPMSSQTNPAERRKQRRRSRIAVRSRGTSSAAQAYHFERGTIIMMTNLVVLALLCGSAFPVAAQTKLLVEKSRVPVSVAGDYRGGLAYPTACDEHGRLYVKLVEAGPGMVGPVFRLSSKGLVEAKFDTGDAIINRYAVRPNNGVIMIHSDGVNKFIDNFTPDGTRELSVRLEPPPTPFFPSQLAVFHSGEILVAGLQYHPGYKASTAIYDPTGHLVKQLVLDGDVEIERGLEVSATQDTLARQQHIRAIDQSVALAGDDGLIYLMRATSPVTVYAISAAGDVIRRIAVSPPTGMGSPNFGIRVVKNRIAIQFRGSCDNSDSDSCHAFTYAIVDATTGKSLAAYEAEKEVAGTMACYAPDPDRLFIFSASLDHHGLDIVEAVPK